MLFIYWTKLKLAPGSQNTQIPRKTWRLLDLSVLQPRADSRAVALERFGETAIPAPLSSLSVCLQFHNCWLPWSRCQRAPDARYKNQPGSSSESPRPAKSHPLRLFSGHAPPVPSSGPSDLLLALHSPVLSCLLPRHNNTINLHLYLRSGVLCHFSISLWYIPLSRGGGGGFWAGRRKTRWGRNMRECYKFRPRL